MRKTLITIAVIGGAYILYKMWMDKQKKEAVAPPSKVIDETIALATINVKKVNPIIKDNRATFKVMREGFNSDESATVAPSINAKIGIF